MTIQACEIRLGDLVDLVDLETSPIFAELDDVAKVGAKFELNEVCDVEIDEPGMVGLGFESVAGIFYLDPHQPLNVERK